MREISDATFNVEVIQSPVPVLVVFTAKWAGPCNLYTPKVTDVEKEYGSKVKFALFDIDDNPSIPETYGVRQVPLTLTFKQGTPVDCYAGDLPLENLYEIVKTITGENSEAPTNLPKKQTTRKSTRSKSKAEGK